MSIDRVINSEVIECYLATLTGKNPDTLRRERKILTNFLPFWNGQDIPTALNAFQQALKERGNSTATARRYCNRAEAFCHWKEKEEDIAMRDLTPELKRGETQNNDVENEAAPMEAQTTKRKAGRPRRTDGKENRSQKFSLYLPPSLYQSLDELARFQGCSITDILVSLAEKHIKDHEAELEIFRKARQEAAKL